MKKSNKVLLIAFLSFLLIITAVHLSLSAKYKRGDYTIYSNEKAGVQYTSYTGVQQVVLKDLGTVNLGVADTASVGKKTNEQQDYSVEQNGAILYVTGKSFVGHQTQSRTAVWISIPSGSSVTATNASLSIQQNKTVAPASMSITLNKAGFYIDQYQKSIVYDSVSITALERSAVEIRSTQIKSLNLRLQKSTFTESGNAFESLQLAVDTSSEVSLSAPHLIKAKIIPVTND